MQWRRRSGHVTSVLTGPCDHARLLFVGHATVHLDFPEGITNRVAAGEEVPRLALGAGEASPFAHHQFTGSFGGDKLMDGAISGDGIVGDIGDNDFVLLHQAGRHPVEAAAHGVYALSGGMVAINLVVEKGDESPCILDLLPRIHGKCGGAFGGGPQMIYLTLAVTQCREPQNLRHPLGAARNTSGVGAAEAACTASLCCSPKRIL